MSPARMETLRQALARLEGRGFTQSLRATPNGLEADDGAAALAPEQFVIEETVRFEGTSDPDDQSVLFALRSLDGRVRGTFVASYGAGVDAACAAVVQRLPAQKDPDR